MSDYWTKAAFAALSRRGGEELADLLDGLGAEASEETAYMLIFRAIDRGDVLAVAAVTTADNAPACVQGNMSGLLVQAAKKALELGKKEEAQEALRTIEEAGAPEGVLEPARKALEANPCACAPTGDKGSFRPRASCGATSLAPKPVVVPPDSLTVKLNVGADSQARLKVTGIKVKRR